MVSPKISAPILTVVILLSLLVGAAYNPRAATELTTPTVTTTTLPTATPPPATTTTTQPTRENRSWWISTPQPLTLAQGRPAVAVCYPWLVTDHLLINMPTGEIYPGTGGDTAVSTTCGSKYMIVRGAEGVYVFKKDTGTMIDMYLLGKANRFVGSDGESFAIYDAANNMVDVKFVGSESTDIAVKLRRRPLQIAYTVVDGVPIVLYSYGVNGSVRYAVANPGEERELPATGPGAVAAYGRTLVVSVGGGVRVYRVVDAVRLELVEAAFIPLPFTVTKFLEVVGENRLLAESYGNVVYLDIERRSYRFVGNAEPTPVGYYLPDVDTTYVVTDRGIHPVPGFAVGVLGNAVVTNIPKLGAVLWPLETAVAVVYQPLEGQLYVKGGYAVKVVLQPGVYRLPRYSMLRYGAYAIMLKEDEVELPPRPRTVLKVVRTAVLNYTVSRFPKHYEPVDRVEDVRYVATGGGKLLLIRSDGAVVYSPYGVTAAIPGRWLWGGLGDCVVLYDGAAFRLYDFGGNPLTSYYYYLAKGTPSWVACEYRRGVYYVHVMMGWREYIIGPSGAEHIDHDRWFVKDFTTGLTVEYRNNYVAKYAGVEYPIPTDASVVRVNSYYVLWIGPGYVSLLSIPSARVYTLIDVPNNVTFYPINDEYVAMENIYTHTIEILPIKSWLVSHCYVEVVTDPDAAVYINGKPVGKGTVRVYVRCGSSVHVKVVKPYHTPAEKTVMVVGATTVVLHPKPRISTVTLTVLKPENLPVEAVELDINGKRVVWKVGAAKQLVAGMRYTIRVLRFLPLDVCAHPVIQKSFAEGRDRLVIACELTASVLALVSKVDTNVKVFPAERGRVGVPVTIQYVPANITKYVPLEPGVYQIVSEPVAKGYSTKVINVTLPEKTVMSIDVTPLHLGRIIVRANVPTALIEVLSEKNERVARGTGSIDVAVEPGVYQINVRAPGYRPYIDVVEVPAGETKVLNVTLQPLPPPPKPTPKPVWMKPEVQVFSIIAVAAAAAVALWWKRRRRGPVEVSEEVEVARGGGR